MSSFGSAPFAGSLVVDHQCRILWADEAAGWVLGTHRTALVDSSLDRFLGSDLTARIHDFVGADTSHGAVFDTGDRQVIVRPTPDASRFSIVVEDIRARQAAWHRLELNQATIDRIADMIIWLDPDGRYVFVNPAASALLGYTADELSRLRVVDVDPEFDEQRWQEHWRDIVERKSFTIETVNTTKSGVNVPIEVTVNYVEHDGAQYNCSIVRDITERKLIETRLLELNEKITRLSMTDDLSGIPNRRYFDAALAEQIDAQTQSGAELSLIMLDIDYFKAFNDRYGHIAGDECLRRVAEVVARSVSEIAGGVAARYGGEEFLCLLPNTGRDTARTVAAHLQQAIAELAIPHAASGAAEIVTVSVGVLTTRNATGLSEILAAVDAHLYRAKRDGRNRIAHGT